MTEPVSKDLLKDVADDILICARTIHTASESLRQTLQRQQDTVTKVNLVLNTHHSKILSLVDKGFPKQSGGQTVRNHHEIKVAMDKIHMTNPSILNNKIIFHVNPEHTIEIDTDAAKLYYALVITHDETSHSVEHSCRLTVQDFMHSYTFIFPFEAVNIAMGWFSLLEMNRLKGRTK